MDISWLKVFVASLIMQLPLIPFFWKGYFPFGEPAARRLGVASRVLVGPNIFPHILGLRYLDP